MVISTYDNDFCGLQHWATSYYLQDAAGGNSLEAAAGATGLALYDLPPSLRRRAEFFARDNLCLGYHIAAPIGGRRPRERRARSAGPAGRRRGSKESACNLFKPFVANEPPRGKFASFPTAVTRLLPQSPDPLGYTPYGPSTATGRTAYMTEGGGSGSKGLVQREERGRCNRFPAGGYVQRVEQTPMIHSLSRAEDSPIQWRSYSELEDQPRRKSSRYPQQLDPYPSYEK
eukprot:TRINITY_DN63205_c0_g1_i1.p1 TRINITY_DN63205_c0_g1~~TRINITY_DN63205_c0_g1_i1.p1  ORF type:complete len:230 (+),score=20.00 TRINITY_DN63205_c0_g1_i1:62-751(+)